jgi:micrococcal nuclease
MRTGIKVALIVLLGLFAMFVLLGAIHPGSSVTRPSASATDSAARLPIPSWSLVVPPASPSIADATLEPTHHGPPLDLPAEGIAAVVDDVVDGDTIHVWIGGVPDTIRIIGIDTPETKKPGTPIECYGLKATAAAESLMPPATNIVLELDPTQDTRDRYGRLLAHVVLADGRLFAEVMIQGGLGIHYIYDDVPSMYADRLAAAQQAAERTTAGLWARNTCHGDVHIVAP